jgi:hypothetical protein
METYCGMCYIQGVPFKTQPKNNHYYGKKLNKQQALPRVTDSPNLPCDIRVKVTLVARPLLTPVAQKLCGCEHGLFTSRTCVHSRILLSIEIVSCCS